MSNLAPEGKIVVFECLVLSKIFFQFHILKLSKQGSSRIAKPFKNKTQSVTDNTFKDVDILLKIHKSSILLFTSSFNKQAA